MADNDIEVFLNNAFGPNGVIEPREALRYYQILANEHVARYPDRPADVEFSVTLEQLVARRDADRAAAAAAGGTVDESTDQPEDDDDEEETEEDAAEAAVAEAFGLTFLGLHLFQSAAQIQTADNAVVNSNDDAEKRRE
jgi:hypothetical protein